MDIDYRLGSEANFELAQEVEGESQVDLDQTENQTTLKEVREVFARIPRFRRRMGMPD